jgi:hypothetical protein
MAVIGRTEAKAVAVAAVAVAPRDELGEVQQPPR